MREDGFDVALSSFLVGLARANNFSKIVNEDFVNLCLETPTFNLKALCF